MGGGGQSAQTQQVTKVELPAWVDQAAQSNYARAQGIANTPLQQYEGQTVAGPSDLTNKAYSLIGSSVGATNPLYNQAADLYTKSAGPLDINSYLNPYTNEVEQRAIGNANTSLAQQLRSVSDQAKKSGAFGGSRSAIDTAVTRAQGVKNIGDLTAQLRQQGFDTAAGLATNQQAGQRAAAAGLLSTAGGQQGATQADIQNLLTGGAQQTSYAQSLLDAAQKKFYEARDYPTQQLNLLLASLGMTPYGKTETSNKDVQQQSDTDWSTVGLGVLKALPGLVAMSDRNTKTDITKIGRDPESELDIYSYRYKGDPKTYPKVVGPMAQDVEKKYPKAVKKVGRYKVIDINNLLEVLS